MASSSTLTPPPAKTPKLLPGVGSKRATRRSQPWVRSADTGTMPTRRRMPWSRQAAPRTRASAWRMACWCCGGTISTAPSPPNRKGIDSGAHRFLAAAMAIAATKFTVLCRPSAMAWVEPTMSVSASDQSSGAGR